VPEAEKNMRRNLAVIKYLRKESNSMGETSFRGVDIPSVAQEYSCLYWDFIFKHCHSGGV
jgi:hypothetical protein